MMKRMPLALNVIQKKVLCSAEKSSVIWAEPHSRSSAEQFGRTERSVGRQEYWPIKYHKLLGIGLQNYQNLIKMT